MSLPATAVWEVRTTGNDANGGGFNASRSGATKTADDNYTYGASYGAISYTDLYSDGASLNKLKSDTRAFVTADIGHIIQLGAGTNRTATLFFEITAVASGVATLDANAWSAENSAKDGVGKLGGALASPGKCMSGKVAGNTTWIKAGTYTITSASTNISGGCVADNQGGTGNGNGITRGSWVGYGSSRGDGVAGVIWQLNAGVTSATMFSISSSYVYLDNIEFDGNSQTSAEGINMSAHESWIVRRCIFRNCDCGGNVSRSSGFVMECYAKSCSTYGFYASLGALYGCVANQCGIGFKVGTAHVVDCLSYKSSGNGFECQNTGSTLIHCVAYDSGGTGFEWGNATGGCRNALFVNCLATDSDAYGFLLESGRDGAIMLNCAGYSNASGNSLGSNESIGYIPVTDGTPFVAASTGNLRLNTTALRGALLRGAGYDFYARVFETTVTRPDIGAVQHGDTTVPAVGDVESGVTFGDGAALTGTFVVPAEEDVEDGVTYGAGGTEFEGTLAGGGGNVIVIED
jgi:hypothetical protein